MILKKEGLIWFRIYPTAAVGEGRGVEVEQEVAHWHPEGMLSPDLALAEARTLVQRLRAFPVQGPGNALRYRRQ